MIDIKKIRKDLKMSQTEFGNLVGVSRQTIVNWEKGDVIPEPKKAFIERILNDKHLQSDTHTVNEPATDYIKISKSEMIETLKQTITNKDKTIALYEEYISTLKQKIEEIYNENTDLKKKLK